MKTIVKKCQKRYNDLDVNSRNIIIWGMGTTTQFYLNAFKTENIKIYGYMDSKSTDGEYNGRPIISLSGINNIINPLIIICVYNKKALSEIEEIIKSIDIEFMNVDEFFFAKNADILIKNYNKLADERSKFVYKYLIQKRLELDFDFREIYEDKHYFGVYPFNVGNPNEVYVDIGAFVGDNIEPFLFQKMGYVKQYYAFEPDGDNYKALLYRVDRINREWNFIDKIIPVKAAVGEKSQTMYFMETNDTNSKCTQFETSSKVEIISLDEFFNEQQVDTIKADIESFELLMLKGAKKLIKECKPDLAISIYHNASDMYSIMDFIDKFKLDYNFYIRHHSFDNCETVLYATCKK